MLTPFQIGYHSLHAEIEIEITEGVEAANRFNDLAWEWLTVGEVGPFNHGRCAARDEMPDTLFEALAPARIKWMREHPDQEDADAEEDEPHEPFYLAAHFANHRL